MPYPSYEPLMATDADDDTNSNNAAQQLQQQQNTLSITVATIPPATTSHTLTSSKQDQQPQPHIPISTSPISQMNDPLHVSISMANSNNSPATEVPPQPQTSKHQNTPTPLRIPESSNSTMFFGVSASPAVGTAAAGTPGTVIGREIKLVGQPVESTPVPPAQDGVVDHGEVDDEDDEDDDEDTQPIGSDANESAAAPLLVSDPLNGSANPRRRGCREGTRSNSPHSESDEEPTLVEPAAVAPVTAESPQSSPTEFVNGEPVVATLQSLSEDPFTLETFDAMIRSHARAGKDFIIARVTTVDTSIGEKKLYHHYSAHQINKVIFRTQPEEGLLHRMKAKNPLNNMTIVGDVFYFSVKASHVLDVLNRQADERAKHYNNHHPRKLHKDFPLMHHLDPAHLSAKITRLYNTAAEDFIQFMLTQQQNYQQTMQRGNQQQLPQGSSSSSTSFVNLRRVLSSQANEDGEESPLLLHSASTTEGATITTTTTAGTTSLQSLFGMQPVARDSEQGELWYQSLFKKAAALSLAGRRRSADDVFTTYGGVVSSTGLQFATEHLEDGSPTTTGVYSGSGSGVSGKRKLRMTSVTEEMAGDEEAGMVTVAIADATTSPTSLSKGGVVVNPECFVAEYVGSDDDFLFKSELRSYFRKHALEADDAVLFSIPPDTIITLDGQEGEEEGGDNAPEGWLIKGPLLWVISVTYIFGGFLIVRFAVPPTLIFITTFLLTFTYCLFIIIIMP